MVFAEGKLQLAPVGNALGVFHRLGIGGEQPLHLLGGAEIEVPRLVAHPVFIVHRFPCLDAQQHVVAVGILFPQIMGVIGTYQRNARLLMHPQQRPVDDGLVGNAVILQFQVVVVLAEQIVHLQGVGLGPLVIVVQDPLGHLAGQASRQGDQTFMVFPQQIHIDAGLVVKALHIGLGHHVAQIPIARLILAQQHQVPGFAVEFMCLVKPAAAGHVDLTADNGMDALRLAGPVKVDDAVHGAVVGNGAGRLPHLPHQLRQVADAAGAVQQAIFRMHMQMYEGHIRSP